MHTKNLKTVRIAALAVAAVVTVMAMLRAAAWSVDSGTVMFLLWAISPYACFLAAGRLVEKFASLPHISLILCVVSLLMLGFTLLIYLGTLGDTSSTGALIFLFVPLYLYIGGFVILTLSLFVSWLSNRRNAE